MDIILIAGMWLDGRAWDDVVPGLEAAGHRAVPLTLPGQRPEDETGSATLDDQLAAALEAVDAADGQAFVVGHSGACSLAWLVADRRPEKVAGVALIGGFPEAEGNQYFGYFPAQGGAVRFPGWEPFDGADAADLDETLRARMEAQTVGVAEGVATSVVHYTDPRRAQVPLVMVCPEYSVEQAKEWVASGELSELTTVETITYADIDSGHWPMFSRPDDLARLLAELATEAAAR